MARIFTCGFELQSLTANVEIAALTGTGAISTTTRHRASIASFRSNPSAATGYVEAMYTSGVNGRSYYRFYLYIATLPSATATIFSVGQSGYFPVHVQLTTTGTLQLRDTFNSVNAGSASAALSTGRWYRIELDVQESGSTAVTREVRGYLEGVDFSGAAMIAGSSGYSRLRAGVQTTATADVFIDDIAVNDTSGSVQNGLPGPGNVVHLRPDSTGDNAGFATTVGGSSNWGRVSETTPDDATTYNATVATGTTTVDDFNLSSTSSAGVSGERVALVAVGGRIGSDAATAASIVYRLKSQASGTVTESASVSVALNGWATHKAAAPFVYQLVSYTDPQSGGAWTAVLLDQAQIGYRSNVSQTTARRVSTLWLLVETVPLTTGALGTATETDTGQGLAKTKAQALGIDTETSAAQPLARRKTLALGTAAEVGTAQALTGLAGVAIGTLTDDFNDGAVDLVKWPDSYEPGGYTETGGRARVACNTDYNAYASAEGYRLRESSVHVRVWPPAAGGASTEAWTQVLIQTQTLGTDAIFEVSALSGNLIMASRVGYSDAGQVAIPYDSSAHAWLRIRETGGQLFWDTSPDGTTWTNRRTATSPSWVGDTTLQVQLIAHRSDGVDDFAEFDSFNTGASQSADLTSAAETVAAQTLTGGKARLLELGSESSTPQPVTGRKTKPLGTAGCSDAAQALAGGKRAVLGTAAGTDTAQALAAGKRLTLTPAASVDSAQALPGRKSLALGTAIETSSAPPLGGALAQPLTAATEPSTVQPLSRAKRQTLGMAITTETARAFGGRKTSALGAAVEGAAAAQLLSSKASALGAVVETAAARTLAGGKRQALGTVEETSSARILDGTQSIELSTVGEATEAVAVAGRKVRAIGTAAAVETAWPLTGDKQLALGTAFEVTAAQHLTLSGSLTTAAEVTAAQPLGAIKARLLGPASETSGALPLAGRKQNFAGAAGELSAAGTVGGSKARAFGVAGGTATARPLAGGKQLALGTAQELSRALIGPAIRLTTAGHRDEAQPLTWRRQRPADRLTPSTSGPSLTTSTSGPSLTTGRSGPALAASSTTGG
ncbi:hypothetical protein ACFWWC_03510 [Streptomyces sp. NPDC058642]|uniref:hypothetical protein n=1 Tax=Streptomyces sp. NPDC058642 TaxID=3346572 RepID=UPI003648C404